MTTHYYTIQYYLKVAVDERKHVALVVRHLKLPREKVAADGRHLALVHVEVIVAAQGVPAAIDVADDLAVGVDDVGAAGKDKGGALDAKEDVLAVGGEDGGADGAVLGEELAADGF